MLATLALGEGHDQTEAAQATFAFPFATGSDCSPSTAMKASQTTPSETGP